jgi:hypothetical protein
MTDTIGLLAGAILQLLHSRRTLLLENLALRQQLAALKRRHPKPRLSMADKLFWILARRFWSRWKQTLIVVTPETVVRWHRAGFRLYWELISKVRRPIGRRQTPTEVQDLIFRMVAENPTWGSAAHPRRASHAWFRYLGTNDFSLDETSTERSGTGQTLACISAESPGSHRGDGFLYHSNPQVQHALRLLCDPSRSSSDSPLQRHQASDKPVNRPAVARGFSV